MSDSGVIADSNFGYFLYSKIELSIYSLLPFFLYFLYIVYLDFTSKTSFYPFKQLSDYSLKSKIKMIIMIILCNTYEIAFTFIYDSHISPTDEIVYIFLIFVKIILLLFIIFHIKEKSIKIKKSDNKHLLLFWVFFSFKNIIEIKYEFDAFIVYNFNFSSLK